MAITFKVGFQVDDKELNAGLAGIQKNIQQAFNLHGGMSAEIKEATQSAMVLEKALKRATTDKGVSYHSLNSELHKAGLTAAKLTTTLARGGDRFKDSLNAANTALALSNRRVISLNRKIQEMSRVMMQSFKFTAAQAALRSISSSAQQAYRWTVDLNNAVNEIGVVTGKTASELDRVTQSAVEGSRRLKVAAKDYAEGALIFYQQGLNDEEVTRRNEITIKAAKAAGQSVQEMSSQLTAIWNTYGMVGDEQARAASVGAKMAAQTAVDFKDIAQAMQTAAAPAAQMGVSYDSLAAIIATVGDTTQQSASVIGNAFKTIFSRFQQLKSSGTDGEVTLNRVSQQLQELGVNVLDGAGNLRQLDEVIQEVGNSWDGWSSKQQLAIAQLVGGTRQYGQFLALMSNFDKYQANLKGAQAEDGSALEQQYTQSLESIEEYAKRASEAWKRSFQAAFDEEAIKGFYSVLKDVGETFGNIMESIGGLPGLLTIIGGLFANKLVVATANFAHNLKNAAMSLTEVGRQKVIMEDYSTIDAQLKAAKGELTATGKDGHHLVNMHASQRAKEIYAIDSEQAKNQFNQNVAIVNDKINTRLETATGQNKINLQYMQGQLKTAEELYRVQMDNLEVLRSKNDEEKKRSGKLQDDLLLQKMTLKDEESNLKKVITTNKPRKNKKGQPIKQDPDAANKVMAAKARLQEVQLELGNIDLRLDNLNQGAQEYRDNLIELNDALAKMTGTADHSSKAAYDAYNQWQEAIAASKKIVDPDMQKAFNDIQKNTKKAYNKVFSSADPAAVMGKEKFTRSDFKATTGVEFGKLLGTADSGVTSLETFNKYLEKCQNLTDEQRTKLIELHKKMEEDASGAIRRAVQETADLTEQTQLASEATEDLKNTREILESGEAAHQAGGRVDMGKAGVEATKKELPKFGDYVEGLGSITGAATTAAAAIKTVWSAMSDPEATSTEKILSVVSAIAMLSPAFTMAKAGLDAMNISIGKTGITILGTTYALKTALPVIALISAAIAALIAIGKMLWEDYKANTPEGKLESAKKAAENLHSELDQATASADKLRETFDRYKVAEDKLNRCTRGTQEWKDALRETNAMAEELLANLPDGVDASGLFNRDKHGIMRVDQNRAEEIQEESDRRVKAADLAATLADTQVEKATQNVTAHNIAEDINKANGRFAQANVDKIADSLDSLAGLDFKDFKAGLAGLGVAATASDTKLKGLQEQVDNFSKTVENANEKMTMLSKLKVDQLLGDQFSGDVKDMLGNSLDKKTEKIAKDLLGKYTGAGISKASGADNDIAKEMLEDYNAATGKNWALDRNAVRGTDATRTFAFLDEAGELHEMTAKQVANTIAASQALEELTGNAKVAARVLEDIESSNHADGLKGFVTNGNFNAMSKETIDANKDKDFNGMSTWLQEAFDTDYAGLTEIAKTMGYETTAGFIQAAQKAFQESATAWDEAGQSLSKTPQKIFEEIKSGLVSIEHMSVDQIKTIESVVESVFENNGADGVQFLKDTFAGLGDNTDEFADALGEIDWQDASPEDIAARLSDFGITAENIAKIDIPKLIDMMQQASDVSLSSAMDFYQKVSGAIGDISDDNSIVSEEQAMALADAGIALDQYFTQMADGTYKLIGDASEFKRMAEDIAMKPMRDAAIQASQDAATFAAAQGMDEAKLTDNSGNYTNQQLGILDSMSRNGEFDRTDYQELEGIQDSTEKARAVAAAMMDAGVSSEKIQACWEQSSEEAHKIQQAIEETEFKNDVERFGLDLEDTEGHAHRLAEAMREQDKAAGKAEKSMEDYERASRKASIANQRLNRGVRDANTNMDKYKETLTDANKGSIDYSKTMDDFKGNLADIFNVADGDLFSDDFAENMLTNGDFEKLLAGDETALNNLRVAATEDIVTNIRANVEEGKLKAFDTAWTDLKAKLEQGLKTGDFDDANFITSMNKMIAAAGMTKEQITSMLGSMGVDAKIHTEYEEQETEVPTYIERVEPGAAVEIEDGINPDGSTRYKTVRGFKRYSIPGEPMKVKGYVPVYSLETVADGTSSGGSIETTGGSKVGGITPVSSGPISSGNTTKGVTGNKGGGSTPKHQAKNAAKRDPMRDRYSTIKADIADVDRSISKLDSTMNHAWGANRLLAMKRYNVELQRQGRYYKDLYNKARSYFAVDQDAAQKSLKAVRKKIGSLGVGITSGIKVEFDDDGFIANRSELITEMDGYLEQLYNSYKVEADAFDKAQSTSEAWSEKIENKKKLYDDAKTSVDELVAALDLVDETANEAEEALQQAIENIHNWLQNKIDMAMHKIEIKVEINDFDIDFLDQLKDNFGKIGIVGGQSFEAINKQLGLTEENVDATIEGTDRLFEIVDNIGKAGNQAWFKNEFGEEAWNEFRRSGKYPAEVLEALKENKDALAGYRQQIIDSLVEQWEGYMETIRYYLDEFDNIANDISSHQNRIDALMTVIDHMGYDSKSGEKFKDSDKFKLMESSLKNTQLNAKNAMNAFNIAQSKAAEMKAEMDSILGGRDFSQLSEDELLRYNNISEGYEELRDQARDLSDEAYGYMAEAFDKAAEYAQITGEKIAHEMSESLGADFDDLSNAMDMFNQKDSLDKFFMDDYDKGYELDKLMHEIEQSMKDATNPEGIKAYDELIGKINAKKEAGVQMTQKEMDILRAEFELAQARDTYEDARNAKNTMRLARDASGNWAYTYSSDTNQDPDQSQQKIEDALHNIHKMHREAADEMGELWLQTQTEMFEFEKNIDQALYENDEKYRLMIDQRREYFKEQLSNYADYFAKHNEAIGRNQADTTLGIIANIDDIKIKNDEYEQAHDQLVIDLRANYQSWMEKADETRREVTGDAQELSQAIHTETGKIMTDQTNIAKSIETMNVRAQNAMSALGNFTATWSQRVISYYDNVIRKIDEYLAKIGQAQAEAAQGSTGGFNATLDYTAAMNNYAADAKAAGWTTEQLMADATYQQLGREWLNKVHSDMYVGKDHGAINDTTRAYTDDKMIEVMQSIAESAKKIADVTDENKTSQEIGNQGGLTAGEITFGHTATGGLVKTPQIRSLAEEGPELVLNAADTQNILNTVSMVRQLVADRLSSLSASLKLNLDNQQIAKREIAEKIEQEVRIEASFPNVSVASEIEEAFNNLVNQAAQYNIHK